jgi:hypothetical protein
MVNLDGSGKRQLTHSGRSVMPRVTPDGQRFWAVVMNEQDREGTDVRGGMRIFRLSHSFGRETVHHLSSNARSSSAICGRSGEISAFLGGFHLSIERTPFTAPAHWSAAATVAV